MHLGELLRNNYDIERVAITIKALELFMSMDYLQAETDLEKLISDWGNITDTSSLLSEIDNRIIEHLVFIVHEYGITLNSDYNPSLYEMYTLVNGIELLTQYDQPEDLLDVIEAQEDNVERIVEAIGLVVKDMLTGNILDYYNIVESTTEDFWKSLILVVEGTKEEIVDFDAKVNIKPPLTPSKVWEWIELSGRAGYRLDAAFKLHDQMLDETLEQTPKRVAIQQICLELKTLVHYSGNEDKSDDVVYQLLEELDPNPDTLLMAQSFLPYIDLGL